MSPEAHELHLHDPQTLYRHWEESQWSPWDVDLSADREQWQAMEDRSLVSFVLGSLMVAEERIDDRLVAAHERLMASPGDVAAKVGFVTIYHLVLEATLGLTTFEFSTRFLEREGLLPGFVAGYTKIHHDEHRHIGYGIWFLRQAVALDTAMGDVVRETLRQLLHAVAESLTPPAGADASVLGASADELRAFALDGLTRRLNVVGVPFDTL